MYNRISKSQAQVLMAQPDTILIDIRDSQSYENGHLDGSININDQTISEFINTTIKTVPVLVVCYHGNSSQTVAKYLSENGFTDVYSIDGGYEGWIG